MKIIAALFCFLTVFSVSAQDEISLNPIEIEQGVYKLRVDKSPFNIKILRGNKVISATSEKGGFSFGADGKLFSISELNQWQLQQNTLFLSATSSPGDIQADITITMKTDKVELSLELPEYLETEEIQLSFDLTPGKHWYGGHVNGGHNWPLESSQVKFDPFQATSNQGTPFWLSSAGVGYFLPTYKPMSYSINDNENGKFQVSVRETNNIDIQLLINDNATEVYRKFAKTVGLPKTVPPRGFFEKSIFNTWIEYMKNIDQEKVLEYAHKIREEGFPCEVLMIDAGWTPIHGEYEFEKEKFPDPKAMIDELHEMDFKLLLWISPYVRKEAANFNFLESNGFLIKGPDGKEPGSIKWWGGNDYELDMSNPEAFNWFMRKLRHLQRTYGVDGFKQDGGDAKFIPEDYQTFTDASSNRSTDYWAKLGEYFDYNEYRVSWLMQSSGLVQRLRDKHNNWTRESGLGSLIPHGLTNSLIGYSYFCPDMIGGGDAKDFRDPDYKGMGTELFIRWTQASALMPMMQFSYAPWNLDKNALAICRKYAQLHQDLGSYIYQLALQNAQTGDPIARPLFFDYPNDEQAYLISDQFMLGERFLVAPVLEEGAVERDIYLPEGLWKDYWTSKVYTGKKWLENFPAPIDVLPLFIKLD